MRIGSEKEGRLSRPGVMPSTFLYHTIKSEPHWCPGYGNFPQIARAYKCTIEYVQ